MKKMKKFIGLLVVMTMLMGLSMTAMAATYSITIDNPAEGHTYEAYQIFIGDLADGKLSNIEWGTGVTPIGQTEMGDAEAKAATLTDETAGKAFAVELIQYLNTKAIELSERVGSTYVISNLVPGYYLIKDQDNSLTGDNAAYTSYILKIAANETITPKTAVPTSHKKVDDAHDSDDTENGINWIDSADYDIGDKVPFQLTGTLPSNYGEYTTYKMIFHDEQSAGLVFNDESVQVFVNNLGVLTEVETGFDVVSPGTCEHEDFKCTFEVRLNDVRQLYDDKGNHIPVTKNSIITVEYTSTLNEDAIIGALGNPNTMFMEYSNNPNKETDGETGATEKDTVIVFTYQTIINKVDDEGESLLGATFKLEKKMQDGTWVKIDEISGETSSVFEFTGLDDGIYQLTETDTPTGYNTIDPVIFEIVAQHDSDSAAPKLTLLNSNQIDEGGLTVTENIIFSATVDMSAGTITSSIVNKSGTVLPETGGMGTTLFYALGGILVVGAGVLLVTRKRMGK